MTIQIAPLCKENHDRCAILANGYKLFYKTALPENEYDKVWHRLLTNDSVYGLGASINGQLVGIAHYLFHTSIWAPNVCYLQDLFVDPTARGQGVARALIESVADASRGSDAARFYWLTQEHNTTGRALYDKVAKHNGFIGYDYPLVQAGGEIKFGSRPRFESRPSVMHACCK